MSDMKKNNHKKSLPIRQNKMISHHSNTAFTVAKTDHYSTLLFNGRSLTTSVINMHQQARTETPQTNLDYFHIRLLSPNYLHFASQHSAKIILNKTCEMKILLNNRIYSSSIAQPHSVLSDTDIEPILMKPRHC